MNNVPGILTALGGLPANVLIMVVGALIIFWGNSRKFNPKATVIERKRLQLIGGIVLIIAIIWTAAIAIIPYFIGGPK